MALYPGITTGRLEWPYNVSEIELGLDKEK